VSVHVLNRFDAYPIAFGLFIAMVVAWEILFRAGLRRRRTALGKGDLGAIGAGASGLVALIMAFSFSMAVKRFDAREEAVIREAEAVEVAHSRCGYLDAPARSACRLAMARYANLRSKLLVAGADPRRVEAIIQESRVIRTDLGRRAVERTFAHDTPSGSLFAASVSEIANRARDRVSADRRMMPAEVVVVTLALCLALAGFQGYLFGLTRDRRFGAWIGFAAFLSVVMFVTLDLDRPTSGWIRSWRGDLAMKAIACELARTRE
jgi:hypothetical protein